MRFGQIHPELGHFKNAAVAGKLRLMPFFMDHAGSGRHPLNIARADLTAVAAGVPMLQGPW